MEEGIGSNQQPEGILERSFRFAVRILTLCSYLGERPGVPRVLMPQILRAGTSIVSNVEEAQAGQSRANFISKMGIALKEARETHIRLRLRAAGAVVPSRKLQPLVRESDEIRRIIAVRILSTKRGGR
jgi:four helix bundle protein